MSVKINFLYNLVYHIFLIIVPLITTPYVSRKLGATGIGDYAYTYSIAYYFSIFIKLGLNNYGNRTIAYSRNDRGDVSRDFWNIYCFQFILSLIVTGIYILYCIFLASNRQLSICLVIFLISAGLDITWFFWGLEEFKVTVTRSIIINALSTIAIFIFIKNENDIGIYTLILSVGAFGGQILLWPHLDKYVDFVKPSYREVVKHIKPNLLLFLPAVAVSLYKIMDKIMLGVLSVNSEVGYYESSEKIIKVPMAVIESLGTVMQPRMSNLVSNKTDSGYMKGVLKKSIMFTMFCSTAIGFGIMSLAKTFVPWFYGKGFEKCIDLFTILLPSCMFLALTNVFKTQYLLPKKKDKEYIVALFTGAGVNMSINMILIPHLASVGAAIGTLAAEAAVSLVIAYQVHRETRVSEYYSLIIPFVVSGLIMYLCGFQIHFESVYLCMILKTIICGTIYIVTLITQILFAKKVLKTDCFDDIMTGFSDLKRFRRKKKTV